MGNLDAALNNALIARRPGIAAITPLANYVGFFSAGRNAPLLHLEAIFLLSDGQEFSFSHHAGTKPSPNFEATILIDFRDAQGRKGRSGGHRREGNHEFGRRSFRGSAGVSNSDYAGRRG